MIHRLRQSVRPWSRSALRSPPPAAGESESTVGFSPVGRSDSAANRASLFHRPVKLFFCLSRRRASLGKRSDRREPAKDARARARSICTRTHTRAVEGAVSRSHEDKRSNPMQPNPESRAIDAASRFRWSDRAIDFSRSGGWSGADLRREENQAAIFSATRSEEHARLARGA